MQWSDFGPYVHPFVVGLPEPVLHHHVRLAAIEFCRKTLCWTKRLDMHSAYGMHEIEVDPELQAKFVKIKQVQIDGRDWGLVHAEHGIALAATETGEQFAFTENGQNLFVYPNQKPGTPILVRAAMEPTLKASLLHADLDEHAPDIAHGAVASIMRLPLLHNPEHAIHEALFRERIKTISMKMGRGMLAAKMTSSRTMF